MHWSELKAKWEAVLKEKPFTGLISDMDGTLSPIVSNPEEAVITERNLELLGKLSDQLKVVALISGRSVQELQSMVGLSGVRYIGNHGLEEWVKGSVLINPRVKPFLKAVRELAVDIAKFESSGVLIENKGATLSLHYRNTPDPHIFRSANKEELTTMAHKYELKISEGRKVFEFKPPLRLDKGSALKELVKRNKLAVAFFLGDDLTDVAAFRAANELRESGECLAWGIGVRSDEGPPEVEAYADALADGVNDVEEFLEWLLIASSASST